MSVYVVIDMQVKPEAIEQMKAGLMQALPETGAYDGCESVALVTDAADPNHLLIIDKWESAAHYEKYHAWRTESGTMDAFMAALTGEPSIRICEILGQW
jgi:quinol monooxygenase YgiN